MVGHDTDRWGCLSWSAAGRFYVRTHQFPLVHDMRNAHRRILQRLYEHPIVSAQQIQALIGTTFAAANRMVSRLVAAGILSEITGHARHRRFQYEPYVRLFDEH
jgi:Fic family protein